MPFADYLSGNNEVWGIARFSDTQARQRLEAMGVRTISLDLASADLSTLPQDFTHVIQCAHTRLGAGDFSQAIHVNAVSAGKVLQHCSKAEAAIVISSGAVYSPRNEDVFYPFRETDDIGRGYTPWAPTSPISKASLEAVARFCGEAFNLPITIVRLNMVYGRLGGLPIMDMDAVAGGQEITFWADPYPANVIHSDDMCDQLEAIFDSACIRPTVVNWCGDEIVTRRDWVQMAEKLTGTKANIVSTSFPGTPCGSVLDSSLRMSITGPCKVRFWDEFDLIYKERALRYGEPS